LNEIEIYECAKTGYRFYFPFDLSGDSAFYQHFQNFDWYYMPWKWEHEVATKYINDGMDILEVGCAHGSFLERINNLYKLNTSVGLELNESAVIKKDKWEIVNKHIEEYSKVHVEQYDLVCSYQVLEHIADVNSFLDSSISCIKKGGKLIISVPNNESFIKDIFSPLNLPPHHMGMWDQGSLVSLIKMFPLKLLQVHIEELKEYHVESYIASKYYNKRNKFLNKIIKKIHILTGLYQIKKLEVLKNREELIGHTILVVFEKTV
jgi:SAM-dependent methyltransferase